MQKPKDLYDALCSYDNLFLAYKKARKHKTTKVYVIEFESNLEINLNQLRSELLLHSYQPKHLVNFTVRDPKTRKISKSEFRDRVIHHALCNIIEPIFDKTFISDSFANRIDKGTLNAVKRFDHFRRKANKNNTLPCYVLKADIRKYFENINHNILLKIIKHKIKDKNIIWLIRKILKNCATQRGGEGLFNCEKGMPLGNLTSQFFANVYLNELDKYVKHKLKAKYYIRYVDDFVILGSDKNRLEKHKENINNFLRQKLKIDLHPDKSKILPMGSRLTFLGFRIFSHHKLLKKSNLRNMRKKFRLMIYWYKNCEIDYDSIYDFMEGWFAYAKHANTHNLRKKISAELDSNFSNEISTKEINRMAKSL
ncbi:hypothetical protein GF323_02640 [Candidatus Woesearchaeota archaeon]|nr:hypothetical protein [Candidatus Woesearchaeota archaeon]